MDREDLEAIAQVLRGTDIMVVSDEIYAELTYGQHHVSPANLPQLKDRTVLVNGFSKSYDSRTVFCSCTAFPLLCSTMDKGTDLYTFSDI